MRAFILCNKIGYYVLRIKIYRIELHVFYHKQIENLAAAQRKRKDEILKSGTTDQQSVVLLSDIRNSTGIIAANMKGSEDTKKKNGMLN